MISKIVSHAQNGEDVVLARALRDIDNGTYLDIGANDPEVFSVTRAFYDQGWSGLCVEPGPQLAEKFRVERPRDFLLQAVISDRTEPSLTFYQIGETGLSTLRVDIAREHAEHGFTVSELTVESAGLDEAVERASLGGKDIHFAVIDTEGSELQVLKSTSFTSVRPWILVIESTLPMSTQQAHAEWEQIVLDAGYRFCLFDGLSRFYVDERNHPELVEAVSYPAGVFDEFTTIDHERLERRARTAELELERMSGTMTYMLRSVSWRITAPLRVLRRATMRHRKSGKPTENSSSNPVNVRQDG